MPSVKKSADELTQLVEIDIDDRRREQGENLGKEQVSKPDLRQDSFLWARLVAGGLDRAYGLIARQDLYSRSRFRKLWRKPVQVLR